MGALLAFSRVVDAVNTRVGKAVSWLILAAVIVSTVNAIVRYLFNVSSNSWLELQWYLFGATFLLVAPWTLLVQEHIRIDIVNSALSRNARNWIDLLGHLFFLIPVCLVMLYFGWPFFVRSFVSGEISQNAGGLIVWPAKALVPLGFALLLLQGVSEAIKRGAIMVGAIEDTGAGGGHHAAAEAEAQRLLEQAAAEQAAADAARRADERR